MVEMHNYGFFDYRTGDSDKYKYTAEEFSDIFSFIIANGVSAKSDKLDFDADASTNSTFVVKPGAVWINGHYGWNVNPATITLTQGTAGTTDLIVARLDMSNRMIVLEQKAGTAATANEVALYELTWSANGYTVNTVKPLVYQSTLLVFSPTQPTNPQKGTLWIKQD